MRFPKSLRNCSPTLFIIIIIIIIKNLMQDTWQLIVSLSAIVIVHMKACPVDPSFLKSGCFPGVMAGYTCLRRTVGAHAKVTIS